MKSIWNTMWMRMRSGHHLIKSFWNIVWMRMRSSHHLIKSFLNIVWMRMRSSHHQITSFWNIMWSGCMYVCMYVCVCVCVCVSVCVCWYWKYSGYHICMACVNSIPNLYKPLLFSMTSKSLTSSPGSLAASHNLWLLNSHWRNVG